MRRTLLSAAGETLPTVGETVRQQGMAGIYEATILAILEQRQNADGNWLLTVAVDDPHLVEPRPTSEFLDLLRQKKPTDHHLSLKREHEP